MTTHHDDDDAWLDALAGKNKASKNPETELLREKLLKRNRQHMESIGTSSNEMETIRRRLRKEELLESKQKHTLFYGLSQWLARKNTLAWVGAVASLLLTVGITTQMMQINMPGLSSFQESWSKGIQHGMDIVRGVQHTASGSDVFTKDKVMGEQIQIVDDLEKSLEEWELDLISSGIDYKMVRNLSNGSARIHIKLSPAISLLSEDHARVISVKNNLSSGQYIIDIKRK